MPQAAQSHRHNKRAPGSMYPRVERLLAQTAGPHSGHVNAMRSTGSVRVLSKSATGGCRLVFDCGCLVEYRSQCLRNGGVGSEQFQQLADL